MFKSSFSSFFSFFSVVSFLNQADGATLAKGLGDGAAAPEGFLIVQDFFPRRPSSHSSFHLTVRAIT